MVRNNNVRGPTSALTEFLRESGITYQSIARRTAARQEEEEAVNGQSNNAEAGPSNATPNRRGNTNGYDSDNLDEDEDESPAPKKIKLSKKEEAKLKAKAKAKAKAKKDKGQDDDDSADSDDDEYTALSRSMRKANAASPAKPPVGGFEKCAKCEKQFTVTRYTIASDEPTGWLCHPCTKAAGTNPFKKPTAPRKRKGPDARPKVTSFEDKVFPSLASLCIKIISDNINDIEAFGDIGAVNLNEIGRVLAKNRSLTSSNATLMYDIKNTSLTFYDATNLDSDAFRTLASLNPNVQNLTLNFCGKLDCEAVNFWAERLPDLRRVELLGPFLVRIEAWKNFFEMHPHLQGFLITQSPRFDLSCMESLAENCPGITELRLKEVGNLSPQFLKYISTFQQLTYLDLSKPTESLNDGPVIDLLKAVGRELTHLNLSAHGDLTDDFLHDGVGKYCKSLTTLILNNLEQLTDEGVGEFFASFENLPLKTIKMKFINNLGEGALKALLDHSGRTLLELDIRGWQQTTEESLKSIPNHVEVLKKLNIGWCRCADDWVIKEIVDGCKTITEISVFGCNKLTERCPRRPGVNIYGVESHVAL